MADRWFAKFGIFAVLVARLVPGVSFDAVSYAAGLTRVNWARFAGATLLGTVPQTFLLTYLGDRVPESLPSLLILKAILVIAIGATAIILHRASGGRIAKRFTRDDQN